MPGSCASSPSRARSGIRSRPGPPRPEGHAGAGQGQARGSLHQGRERVGLRPGDEAPGHPRRLPRRQGIRGVPRQDRRREQDHHGRPRAHEEMSLGRDGIAGLILLAISLALFVQSFSLPYLPLVPVGPGFYPRIVLAFLALASAALAIQGWRKRRAPAARRNYPLVLLLFGIVAAYVFLLPFIGFRIATALFVAAAQAALDPPRSPRQWAVLAAVALATTAVTYLMFENYLMVLLPRGTWTGW